MFKITLVEDARVFAALAHRGQVRKYTGEPYVTHPIAVAKIVASVTGDQEMIAAALLHDVVEDTAVTIEEIESRFGGLVALYVENLTDISCLDDGFRAARKAVDRAHTAIAVPEAKTIKLADLIHNSSSILEHDKRFAKIYMAEKRLLLDESLKEGHGGLWLLADSIVQDYYGSV